MLKKKCLSCEKEFLTWPCRINIGKGKFCSRKCKTNTSKNIHPWNFKTHGFYSEEYRKKLSDSKIEMFKKDKIYRNKLSDFQKKLFKKRGKEYYRKIGLTGVRNQQNSKEPTSIEKIVYDFLLSKGIIFEKQRLVNGKFLVDVYIPSTNTIIEVDGCYWHGCKICGFLKRNKKDKAENAYLIKCGYNLLRLPEHEINDGSFKERMVN